MRLAEQAAVLGGASAKLLLITAAWTGCRWGELAGLQRHNVDLRRGVIVIDRNTGALHESARRLWLGPPKTLASARTIPLPPFLVRLLRDYLNDRCGRFVFTSLDKSKFSHILRRHHPRYWDGSVKKKQTFFGSSMSIDDVQTAINGVMRENRGALTEIGSGSGQIQSTVNGVDYVLGGTRGRVGQFYPGTLR